MDSHVFRIVGQALLSLLDGARMEKIHGPARDTVVFTIFAGGEKRRLIVGWGQQRFYLFLSTRIPENPMSPPARIMRLRKYVAGRKLGGGILDFTQRRLVFPVLEGGLTVRFLLLDLRHGPEVQPGIPEGFGREPAWPENEIIDECCERGWNNRETEGPWQLYPVLTPLLRETLSYLEPLEGRALLADLRETGQGLFIYGKNNVPEFYCAWPLPRAVEEKRSLFFLRDTFGSAENNLAILEAVSRVDEPLFFEEIARNAAKPEEKEAARENRKLKRLLAKLDQEKKRLGEMEGLRQDAILIQSHLWRFAPEERLAEIVLPPDAPDGQRKTILLNPLLSIRENMRRMFHQSDRGARGLAMLEKRRAALSEQQSGSPPKKEGGGGKSVSPVMAATAFENGPVPLDDELSAGKRVKDVAAFRSSDGYILLRGKNAKGNSALLKLGKPYDLWLHARGGPSAHVIIRKNNAAEEIPARTIEEAAVLVGQKSWQRNAGRVEIMIAFVRHVHPIKGAAPGTVRVDEEQAGLIVNLPQIYPD